MKNLLKAGGFISGVIALILLILGVVAIFNGRAFLGHFWSNYFFAAQTFFFAGIFLLFFNQQCDLLKKD